MGMSVGIHTHTHSLFAEIISSENIVDNLVCIVFLFLFMTVRCPIDWMVTVL